MISKLFAKYYFLCQNPNYVFTWFQTLAPYCTRSKPGHKSDLSFAVLYDLFPRLIELRNNLKPRASQAKSPRASTQYRKKKLLLPEEDTIYCLKTMTVTWPHRRNNQNPKSSFYIINNLDPFSLMTTITIIIDRHTET